MNFYKFDSLFEILHTSLFRAVVGRRDEVVDLGFVGLKKRVKISLIEDFSALRLGEDEVKEEAEAEPSIERDPNENEAGPGFKEKGACEDDPVHEPWLQ